MSVEFFIRISGSVPPTIKDPAARWFDSIDTLSG